MRAVMRTREPDSASIVKSGAVSPPGEVKPVWTTKAQACAVVQFPGVRADGAYREDGHGT
jgi:hypothetical protein